MLADSLRIIYSSWLVPYDEDELDASFTLTALGQSSGASASQVFTDGLAKDGDGTMTIVPTSVCSGSSGNSLTFTFAAGIGNQFAPGGIATFVVPSG